MTGDRSIIAHQLQTNLKRNAVVTLDVDNPSISSLESSSTHTRGIPSSKTLIMDSIEPEQTPFAAVTAQTSKIGRVRGPKWKVATYNGERTT